jgi:hypothetical protein
MDGAREALALQIAFESERADDVAAAPVLRQAAVFDFPVLRR